MDQDPHLAVLRKTYRPPWTFERLESGRIMARRGGYSVTGDDAGSVGRAITEWMSSTGLTGDRLGSRL